MKVAKEGARIKRYIRRLISRRREVLEPHALLNLRFYQFRQSTSGFFLEKCGRTDIRVKDTPHYIYAKALCTSENVANAEQFYRDYIASSWGSKATQEATNERVEEFKAHLLACKAGTNMPEPVLTKLLQSEDFFVVDGNHRVAMMAAIGKPLKVEILPPDLSMLIFSRAKEFYGTGFRDMPYQSIFLNGHEVVTGRRNDALKRLQPIPEEVLLGKSILDVASNIGMSSMFAHELGAKSCLGLEISRKMVDFSTRFSMFEGRFPRVSFQNFNLDNDTLLPERSFDTAFMFSIHDHLKHPENLITLAKTNVSSWVVFEGHPNGTKSDYSAFFNSGNFRSVKEIGVLEESVFNNKLNRILWLCEK